MNIQETNLLDSLPSRTPARRTITVSQVDGDGLLGLHLLFHLIPGPVQLELLGLVLMMTLTSVPPFLTLDRGDL